jgi:hypothetical protein
MEHLGELAGHKTSIASSGCEHLNGQYHEVYQGIELFSGSSNQRNHGEDESWSVKHT